MKTDLEYKLIEGDSIIRRGGALLIGNFGKAIAVITLIAAALVTFTEVSFYSLDSERITTGLAVMLVCSYMMYFSLEDAGEHFAEESDAYKSVKLGFSELRQRIDGKELDRLRSFLQEYSTEELEYRRKNLLVTYGISEDAYKSYVSGHPCNKKERKVLKRASKMKAVVLTAKTLLSFDGARKRSELIDPAKTKAVGMFIRLLPTALCTCVTVSVMLTTKDGLTAGRVIEGILKLLTLPIVGIKGYTAGYRYTVETGIPWIETKSRILEAFLNRENA